jgi:predicted RNA binding protein YcfA (HicA-like mRNA interferase family)
MPKNLELRKVIKVLNKYGVIYMTGKGRHPKFYDPETKKSYPVKSHGKKTTVLSYALNDLIEKFELPANVFEKR